jgi:putative peptidoglycan lipid II flippase
MVFALWMPMVLGLAAYQINFAVNTFLITFLEEKSITYLNYAYRIMHLPAGLFGVAVGTVALQEFSLSTQEELKNKIDEALRLTAILTLPVSAILIGLSYPVVQLLYERGRFTPIDTLSTSRALFFYTFSVFPAASIRIFTSTFYSLKNTKTPALIASFIVVLNILLNLNLMRILRYLSFPLTTSLVSSLHVVILYLFLRKRIGSLVKSDFLPFLLKVALLSLILGYFSHRTFQFLRKFGSGVFLLVFLSAFLSLLLFYLLSRLLKIKELKELFKRLTEKEEKFYI